MDEQEAETESSQDKARNEGVDNAEAKDKPENLPDDKQREAMAGQAGDSLSWIEGPDFDSPIEELPTLQWPDIDAEVTAAEATGQDQAPAGDPGPDEGPAPDELEEAIQWLEGLAEEQGTPLDEMPTLISSREGEPDFSDSEEITEDLLALGDTTPPAEIDSDPMAWLEQLAIDQSSPLEELPSVADRLLASEIVSQVSMDQELVNDPSTSQPAGLEAALQYLEKLAAEQGISLDDVSLDDLEGVAPADVELEAVDRLAKAAAAAAVVKAATKTDTAAADQDDELFEQIPEDPDEALAWLADLAEDESQEEAGVEPQQAQGPAAAADALSDTEPQAVEAVAETAEKESSTLPKAMTMAAAAKLAKSRTDADDEPEGEQDTADEVLDTDILEGMPDDPDEAMLWMAGLAAEGVEQQAEKRAVAPDTAVEEPAPATGQAPEETAGETVIDARHALAAGNVAAAVKIYRQHLDRGPGDLALLEELENAVAGTPDEPELLTLLGDAYMQNGQVQQALEAYRKGLA